MIWRTPRVISSEPRSSPSFKRIDYDNMKVLLSQGEVAVFPELLDDQGLSMPTNRLFTPLLALRSSTASLNHS